MRKLTCLELVTRERLESFVFRERVIRFRRRKIDLFVCQKQALVLAGAGKCHDVCLKDLCRSFIGFKARKALFLLY